MFFLALLLALRTARGLPLPLPAMLCTWHRYLGTAWKVSWLLVPSCISISLLLSSFLFSHSLKKLAGEVTTMRNIENIWGTLTQAGSRLLC